MSTYTDSYRDRYNNFSGFANEGTWEVAIKDEAGVASAYSIPNSFLISGIPNEGTWEVSVKDEAGVQSPYSAPRTFTLLVSSAIELAPIDSAIELGVLSVSPGPVTIALAGVDSSIDLGALSIVPGPVTVSLGAIDSTIDLSTLTLEQIAPTVTLAPIDISAELGAISLEPGPVTISLDGIDSSIELGTLLVTYVVHLTAIDSSIELGAIALTTGPVSIVLAPVDSSIEMGALAVKGIYYLTLAGIDATIELGSIILAKQPVLVYSRRIPVYRVVIADLNGVPIEEVPAKNLQYSYALNNPGGCGFVLPLEHAKTTRDLLAPGQREIHIWRNDDRVWGGYLWSVGVSSNDATIRLAGEGYLSRFERRLISDDLIYNSADQFDIAWGLINYSQTLPGGDLGITRYSATPSGVNRTRKYRGWARLFIMDELESLAEVEDGFDYEITPTKQFRTYYPSQGADNGVVFDLDKNIGSISYDVDATNTVSELHGMGAGSDRNRCISVVTHNQTQTDFGLLQSTADFSNVRSYANLTERATEELRTLKGVRELPQITVQTDDPAFDAYNLGDTVRVRAQKGYISMDRNFRIATQLIQVSDEGYESNQLFMNELIDA